MAKQIYDRLNDDVFVHNPTYIALTFGMNDTDYYIYHNKENGDSISKARIKTSYNSYLDIRKELKKRSDFTKVLVASSAYDETVKFENNYFPGKSVLSGLQ